MGFLDKMKQAKDMYGNMKKFSKNLTRLNAVEARAEERLLLW